MTQDAIITALGCVALFAVTFVLALMWHAGVSGTAVSGGVALCVSVGLALVCAGVARWG